jgi:N-acetylated-alpha-linked acidic dipeptidase
MSVWDRTRANQIVNGSATQRSEIMTRPDLRIGALGSGSDYTPFLQHLGIASLNLGFGGEDGGGSYHSIYDSYDHFIRFVDPAGAYGIALAKVAGRATMRLADADVLPFEYSNFADTIGIYATEVTKLADTMREDTKTANQFIANGMLKAVQDPTKTFVMPKEKDAVPAINFEPLKNAVEKLKESAKKYQATKGPRLSVAKQAELDRLLYSSERYLTTTAGLPRRDWFRHQMYAPGFYTGYGVKTLPGIREAIESRNWKEAAEQIDIAARTIERYAAEIDKATARN